MCLNLVTVGVSAAGEARSTSTQTSSPEETVYVNSYGGTSRTVDFNDHWRFNLGNGSAATDYNDSSWRDVDLPHDYSIEQEYSASNEAESGYLPGGTGWYRKTFSVAPEWEGKSITIDFGGVYMNATVYLNGQELGFHPYGYTAFSFELPNELLNFKGENVIAVKVEHNTPTSRWYSGSGIYRTVHLTVTDPVHVARYGTYVTTPKLETSNGADGTMNIVTTVQNDTDTAASVTLRQTVYQQGVEEAVTSVTSAEATSVPAGGTTDVKMTAKVENPALWSTDDPNLYTLKTEVLVGDTVVDTYETEFGFRWTDFNRTTGFELNGVPTKLKGVCMHHDQGPLGSEAWYRAIERQVEILKDMGCNAIRVTHNPAAPELIEIANEKGMMLIDEAFDMWVMEKNGNVNDYSTWFEVEIGEDNAIVGGEPDMTWAEFDIKAMANQDKNSPAVIMYSLGNEIFEGTANDRKNEYPTIARQLCTWLYEVDNTRPPTFGQNSNQEAIGKQIGQIIYKEFGGISGVNYATTDRLQGWYNLGVPVYNSETASAVNSRGIYDRKGSQSDKNGDYLLTSYDKSAVGWGAVASEAWWRTLQLDWSMGEFVWTGFDYIGEPTPWNGTGTGKPNNAPTWPAPKSSYFGIIDTNGLPKDTYWFYQSQWNEDVTTLHMLPTWNEEDVVFGSNHDVEVVVYSDAAKIELYLNDTLVGAAKSVVTTTKAGYTYRTWTSPDSFAGTKNSFSQKSEDESLYATFWVPYAEGTLKAVAYDAEGNVIEKTEGRSVVKTTDKANKLSLTADRSTITADGDDLSYITIDVQDSDGNLVNTDDVSITLSIEGDGKIIGVDNGRQVDHTSYQSLTRNAGAGELVAVVQSTEDEGSFTVTAKANGLTAGSVTVSTKAPADSGEVENSIVSYQISRNHYVKLGNKPQLPATVVVTYRDGTTATKNVVWNNYDDSLINKVGPFAVTGTIEGTSTTVTVNVTMLDSVAALLNYSAAVQVGGSVNLPASRPAVLADGSILNAEFPVEWTVPADLTATEGIKTVKGTSSVFGDEITVTASIRVAEGEINAGANVAKSVNQLTQSVPEDLQSDSLESIIDGSTAYKKGPDAVGGVTQPNPNVWTNYDFAQNAAGNKESYIQFTYATVQDLTQIVVYYFTDSWATALPETVSLEWTPTGGEGAMWSPLEVEATQEDLGNSNGAHLYRVTYRFDPVSALEIRINLTNKSGNPKDEFPSSTATAYCVGITEVELNLAERSFPVSSSDALTGLTVNGVAATQNDLNNRTYSTEALFVDSLTVESGNNAAYTILPEQDGVIRILTESEDHSTRGAYTIQLGAAPSAGDPADGSRDYDYTKTTATAASEQIPQSGSEGPVGLALDNDRSTFWHSNWSEQLENQPDKRWIMLELEESAVLDALRYQPRPSVANGIVTEYRVEVSMDGEEWTVVSEGTWAHDSNWKIALFDEPVEAKYVKLYGVQTRGSSGDVPNRFMSCAELRVRLAEEKTDLSTAVITMDSTSFDYTGAEIKPLPDSVKLGETALRYGIDYVVDYADNVNPGTATLTIRGIINYSGTASTTFTINPVELVAESYTPVNVTTHVDVAPELPATVTAQVNIGPDQEYDVVWDTIDPAQYAQAGTFTVEGTVEGQTLKPTATVTVIGPVAVEQISAITAPDTLPALPEELTVYFNDGSTETYPVTWTMSEEDFAEVGAVVTVKGTVALDGDKTMEATASVRVAEAVETGNIALAGDSTLPLAVSFYAPASDTAANINDGSRDFSVSEGKKVWSDWERGVFHEAPWVAIVLDGEQLVNKISIGFIDEAASDDPNVVAGNKVRVPAEYEVQYYTGSVDSLDYNASKVDDGRNWPNMSDDANWQTVAVLTKDEIPSSADYAQMLNVTFETVKTPAIRVVMTPQKDQWVGVNELEVYGLEYVANSDFEVSEITLDGENVLDQFDAEKNLTVTLAEGQEKPEVAAVATNNASVTIVPNGDQVQVVITSEDGSKTETYTITFKVEEPEPEKVTVTFNTNGGSKIEAVTVEKGEKVTAPPAPTNGDFDFDGWYTDLACTEPYDFNTAVEKDITLYAGWKMVGPSIDHDDDKDEPEKPTDPEDPDTDIEDPDTPLDPTPGFTDVADNFWGKEAIDYVVAEGLMNGTSETTFAPNVTTTRAMLMTILARMDGVDTTGSDPWYQKGMEWAVAEGVSDGTNPEGTITREQLAVMLYRYSGNPAVSADALTFADADAVSDWAVDSVKWAVANGIISGKGNNTLDPQGNATRAEVAQMLYNFSKIG